MQHNLSLQKTPNYRSLSYLLKYQFIQIPISFHIKALHHTRKNKLSKYIPNMTTPEQQDPLILVYYKVRGKLQPIRNLVCYLGLPVVQVHLEQKEEQKKKLPPQVLRCLQGIRIERANLPLLIYDGHYIYDVYPIMAYLCRKFNREDLFGRNIRQKARVQQILQIYFIRQPSSTSEMFKLGDFASDKCQPEIMKEKSRCYEKLMNESNYIRQICEYLSERGNGAGFIFGDITLIDFIFLQTCHDMLGMFNNLDQRVKCTFTQLINFFSGENQDIAHIEHLETMRAYLDFMHSQPFYCENGDSLESHTIICPSFTAERIRGLRNIWTLNPQFVE